MTKKPESYSDVDSPVLVDHWWAWSVTKALGSVLLIGGGAVAYAIGDRSLGRLMIVFAVIVYIVTPDVHGPIA